MRFTARKYRRLRRLPSEVAAERTWPTRPDPFAEVWPEVHEQLQEAPVLEAKTLFAWLQSKYPTKFDDTQLRSFQRGVKRWRATAGPAKEVFFSQVHHPGRLCASDFTHMKSLAVTIGGQPFDHLVYHWVLTYSNWESITICFSESFESLSEGFQNAVWELGGVPQRHRTDRMSLAVNNASSEKEFTQRYTALLDYYGMEKEKIQPDEPNENGDAEQSHRRFKETVDQALLLRGHRDFESREAYERFLKQLVAGRNAGRRKRLDEELPRVRRLPERRRESYKRLSLRVDSGSLIRADKNTYSVPSRLIGERVEVRLHVEHVEVWYAQREVERFPRLRGRGKHRINYRHIIDWLVRKPGAFENYVYREELFPTSRFRMAYDALREAQPQRGHEGHHESLVVDRTNNLLEQLFGVTKKRLRRKIGTKSLTRSVQAMRPEVLLVANLNDPVYLDFVCEGNLARLPVCFSEHWPLAKTVRHERQQPKRDHPLPTSKKVIRQPDMLGKLKDLVSVLIRLTAEKLAA